MNSWPAFEREASGVLPGAPLYSDPNQIEEMNIRRGLVPRRQPAEHRGTDDHNPSSKQFRRNATLKKSDHLYEERFELPGGRIVQNVGFLADMDARNDDGDGAHEYQYAGAGSRTDVQETSIGPSSQQQQQQLRKAVIKLSIADPPEPPPRSVWNEHYRDDSDGDDDDDDYHQFALRQQQQKKQDLVQKAQLESEQQREQVARAKAELLEKARNMDRFKKEQARKRQQLVEDAERKAMMRRDEEERKALRRREQQQQLLMQAQAQQRTRAIQQQQQQQSVVRRTMYSPPVVAAVDDRMEELDPRTLDAASWMDQKIMDLIQFIKQYGHLGNYNQNEIEFGLLFEKLSPQMDALSGVCRTAKKYGVIYWDDSIEHLLQGRHDHVKIILLKDTHDGVKIQRRHASQLVHRSMNDTVPTHDTCAVCQKSVYPMEMVRASGLTYHDKCFKCAYCGVLLKKNDFHVSADGNHRCRKHHEAFEKQRFAQTAKTLGEDTREARSFF